MGECVPHVEPRDNSLCKESAGLLFFAGCAVLIRVVAFANAFYQGNIIFVWSRMSRNKYASPLLSIYMAPVFVF